MENKPKTSSYKRLKPYIKGFPIPFVLAIVGAIISAVITVIGPDKLKEITNTITEGITPTKMGTIPGIDLDKVTSIAWLFSMPFQRLWVTYKALRLRQLHNVFHNVSVQLSKRKSTVFPLIILTVILKGTPSLV